MIQNGLLLHRIRKDDTSKRQFFFFFNFHSAHEVPTYWAFSSFQFISWQTTLEWSTLSSSVTSCAVVSYDDGYQLVSKFWWLAITPTSSRLMASLQNFLNHHCTVCLLLPGENVLLMLWVVSTASWPILNSNKNISQACFLSNFISLV